MPLTNPKYIALREACNAAKEELQVVNPFMTSFLSSIALDRMNNRKIGYEGMTLFIRLLQGTGLDILMTSPEKIDAHVDWFWALIDEAHSLKGKADRRRGIKAVVSVYHSMDKAGFLGKDFWRPDNSPYYYLCKKSFEKTLVEEYCGSKYIAFLRYSIEHHPHFVVISFRNMAFRDMVLDAFNDWPNKYDREQSALRYVMTAEEWFEGTTDGVRDYRDLTASMLVTARDHILRTSTNAKERRDRMWFMFYIFGTQVRKHPDHHFFRESPVWDAGMVTDHRVSNHIADGFQIAFYGQETPFRQGHGVLLICDHANIISASSVEKTISRVELQDITDPVLWDAVANYCLHEPRKNVSFIKCFLRWLIAEKESDRSHITKADIDAFRVHISRKCNRGEARNSYVSLVTKFLKYASEEGYLTVDGDALKDFLYFSHDYTPQPKPHTKANIERLLVTLKEMAKINPVYGLIRIMVSILCTNSIRAGHLCVISLRQLTFNADGTATLWAKAKNGGQSRVLREFTKKTADRLHKVLELTEEVRNQCPRGSVEDQLFIYRSDKVNSRPFMAMTLGSFNTFLKNACKVAGIPEMPSGSLRDTFFSDFLVHADQRGMTKLQREAVTHHKSSRSISSYVKPDIREILKYTADIERTNI